MISKGLKYKKILMDKNKIIIGDMMYVSDRYKDVNLHIVNPDYRIRLGCLIYSFVLSYR